MNRVAADLLALAMLNPAYADEPYGILDIPRGASCTRLARTLVLRDVGTALAARSVKPDLGSRGYGCIKRDDSMADIGCVSHTEKIDGFETREIRLHFLYGRLQQFSVIAEVRHYDALIAHLQPAMGHPSWPAEKRRPRLAGRAKRRTSSRTAAVISYT